MKRINREYLWLSGILALTLLIGNLLFGLRTLFSWTTNINIYDSYIVLDSTNSFLSLLSVIAFIIYLPRVILSKFQNHTANIVLLLAIGYLIYYKTVVIALGALISTSLTNIIGASEEGWTIYPPLSSGGPLINHFEQTNINFTFSVIQILLILLFGFVAYKAGFNRGNKHSA